MAKATKKENQENPVLEWFKADESLCDIVNAITAKNLSIEENARLAFYEVADHLKLPKQPEDITEEMYRAFDDLDFEPESVFEQMAVINFMADDSDDKRGLVMQALYNIHFRQHFSLENAAVIYYGGKSKIPISYSCSFYGKDIDARIEFEKETITDLEKIRIRKKII